MITIIGRRLFIPDCDRVLGTTDEANTKIRIKLSDETVEKFFPEGVTSSAVNVTLVMETEKGEAFPSIAFVWAKDGVHEGYVNLVGRNYTGLVKARALLTYRGNDSVTVSMQTEEDYFYVTDDINGSGINEGDSEYKAWNALLTDIKSETGKVTDAVDRFESYFTESEGEISKAESHYANFENPHKVTAEQVGAYSKREVDLKVGSVAMSVDDVDSRFNNHEINHQNPHEVTAEQVGAYTKDEVDKKFNEFDGGGGADVDLTDYVKNTDYATGSKGGVVKVYDGNGVSCVNGQLALVPATNTEIDNRNTESKPITPKNLEYAVKSVGDKVYASADVVGDIDTALDSIIAIMDELAPVGR